MKQLLTGNEAVAKAVWESGVHFAAAYPGTPSTEILENLSAFPELHAEWAPNEKVAVEAAIGASLAGGRSFAAMKHVGLNVAADPLFTFAYTGVNGGAVIVTADEPGMYSSQNEQDNRNYARAAKLPMLEPSDSQECYDMVKAAYEISEQFDTPVLIRLTTRVCHSKSVVELAGQRQNVAVQPYTRKSGKYVASPAVARKLRVTLEERLAALKAFNEAGSLNKAELHEGDTAFICSGICYYYAKEVFGDSVSYLKLGMTNPMPEAVIRDFCRNFKTIYVLEENDPFIEDYVRSLGIAVKGKDIFPPYGEMTPDTVRKSIFGETLPVTAGKPELTVPRPPALCAGCPHRGFFYELSRRKNVVVTGDIGCYTLGSSKPFDTLDAVICMGASISMGHGAETVFRMADSEKKVVTVIGDSTFFHSGMTSLLNTMYNGGATVNVILDNRITGMTGHQENPGTGFTASGEPTAMVKIEDIVRAFGFTHVKTIDPNDIKAVRSALDEFLALDEPSVIITRWPCALKKFSVHDKAEFAGAYTDKYKVDPAKCVSCRLCMKAGCPALSMSGETGKAAVDAIACLGCGVCAQICPRGAIEKEEA